MENGFFDALKDWNPWWESKSALTELSGKKRAHTAEILKYLPTREIKILTGVRRSGKSTVMYQIVEEFLGRGVGPKNILLVNFDDNRLKKHDVGKIFESYIRELNPEGDVYLFIDEAQNSPEWWFWARREYDTNRKIFMFISGSASKLIPKEYSALLTGRELQFNVFPLSFSEFLSFKNFQVQQPTLLGTRTKSRVMHQLREFLSYGGFPEVALSQKDVRVRLLNQYFDDIINKDVVDRHGLNPTRAFDIARYLISNVANTFSFRSARAFTGLGMETLERYVSCILDTGVLHLMPIFSYTIKDQLQYPRKIYCIDTGLRNAVSFRFSGDWGRMAENAVFTELKRRGNEQFYWKDARQREVDFAVKEGMKVRELIQVCWNAENPETKKRETDALLAAMEEFKLKTGLILTEDFEKEENMEGKKIRYVPLWKWLLALKPQIR